MILAANQMLVRAKKARTPLMTACVWLVVPIVAVSRVSKKVGGADLTPQTCLHCLLLVMAAFYMGRHRLGQKTFASY